MLRAEGSDFPNQLRSAINKTRIDLNEAGSRVKLLLRRGGIHHSTGSDEGKGDIGFEEPDNVGGPRSERPAAQAALFIPIFWQCRVVKGRVRRDEAGDPLALAECCQLDSLLVGKIRSDLDEEGLSQRFLVQAAV